MKLPQLNRIRREELSSAPPWVDALIEPINLFMEQVYSTLNKNVNNDNLATQIYSATVKTTDFPLVIRLDVDHQVEGVEILQCLRESSSFTSIGAAIFPEWVQEASSTVTIKTLIGISAGINYTIKLRIT